VTNRRSFIQLLAAATSLPALGASSVRAQTANVVRIINGFPSGGVVDAVSRRVGEGMTGTDYASSVVVENRTGAGGRLACVAAKGAPADGNTLLLTPDTVLTLYPVIYSKLDYDPFKDLLPVSTVAATTDALAVGPLVPEQIRTVRDFLAWSKSNPQHASYGSPGTGSPLHLLGSLLSREGDTNLKHIPYRGAAPGVTELMGGQIAALLAPTGNFLAAYRAGKLRILGTSGLKRTPFTPDIPTFSEQKYAGDYPAEDQWFGFFAPRGTQATAIAKAHAAIQLALNNQRTVESLATLGMVASRSSPDGMRSSLAIQHEKWGALVKRLGFTAES
jgi:tripartite-type tricarboxylate transporter receptor subunit TctC